MNMKEAFRFHNKLQQLLYEAENILERPQNVTCVHTTYYRKKAVADAEDETVEETPATEYAQHITQLVDFVMWTLEEQEKLTDAIWRAKRTLDMTAGLDGQVSLNRTRQQVANLLRRMSALRSGEELQVNGGTGYRFNNEGNQISYRCDLKRVTTINFDRRKVRKYCADLSLRSDAVSAQLDMAVVTTPVDYAPPFDVNDSFDDIFEAFRDQK